MSHKQSPRDEGSTDVLVTVEDDYKDALPDVSRRLRSAGLTDEDDLHVRYRLRARRHGTLHLVHRRSASQNQRQRRQEHVKGRTRHAEHRSGETVKRKTKKY